MGLPAVTLGHRLPSAGEPQGTVLPLQPEADHAPPDKGAQLLQGPAASWATSVTEPALRPHCGRSSPRDCGGRVPVGAPNMPAGQRNNLRTRELEWPRQHRARPEAGDCGGVPSSLHPNLQASLKLANAMLTTAVRKRSSIEEILLRYVLSSHTDIFAATSHRDFSAQNATHSYP